MCTAKTIAKKAGAGLFLFFLAKGLVWLGIAAAAAVWAGGGF